MPSMSSRCRVLFGLLVCVLSGGCVGNVSLIQEASRGHTATVQTILAKGADGNARDAHGKTALMLAAFEGHTATVHVLLANGVDANAKDEAGATALMLSASKGHTEIVQALLAKNIDIEAVNHTGWTALMLAVAGGHMGAAQALLGKGASPEAKNQAGQTAITLAQARGFSDILQQQPPGQGQAAGAMVTWLQQEVEKRTREEHNRAKDTTPPRITLLEPAGLRNTRSVAIVSPDVQIVGTVTDESGVAAFSINGTSVPLDTRGRFTYKVPVRPGENVLVLHAIDTHGRSVESSFLLQRDTAQRTTPTPKDTPPTSFGRYHALVIGNNAYRHLPPLETAINDAKTVAEVLRRVYGFEVTLLLDTTREAIVVALDDLRSRLTEQDNLLVYYAGHGILDKEAERGYWLPVDARVDTRANWLTTITVTDTFKAMAVKHAMVVADSCYSGTLLRDSGIRSQDSAEGETYFLRMAQKRSRTALTSGGLEPVLDGGGNNHSVFAKAFLAVLNENRAILDGQQLASQIKRLVVFNSPQTPEYSDIRYAGHEGGDFLFVRKP